MSAGLAPAPSTVAEPWHVFAITWLGQLVSVVGSGLTSFAVGLHVYRVTGSVTQLALVSFCYAFPAVVLSPIAGALVDRWDRRRAMLVSDLGAGTSVLFLWSLLAAAQAGIWPLQPWHLFLPITLISAFSALRWPAYQAATSLLVPRRHLGRAIGMIELATAAGQVLAPMLAAALLVRVGLPSVILADLATFAFAILTLLPLRFPAPPRAASEGPRALGDEIFHGVRYIRARPGLVGLLAVVCFVNVILGLVWVLVTPLVLSVAGVPALGVTFSIAGGGMLLGGVVMSVWGGPRRRLRGLLGFLAAAGVVLFMGALPPSAPLVAAGCASFLFCIPLIGGSASAIWQAKVEPGVQGRVFAARRMVTLAASALAILAAGPLADRWFEPWLAPGGALAASVGRVIGTGPGRGIGFLFAVTGALTIAVVLAAASAPRLRRVEDELPDALPADAPAPQ
jgi:MFS transporter, DHA3 family, macrolide efflux protein